MIKLTTICLVLDLYPEVRSMRYLLISVLLLGLPVPLYGQVSSGGRPHVLHGPCEEIRDHIEKDPVTVSRLMGAVADLRVAEDKGNKSDIRKALARVKELDAKSVKYETQLQACEKEVLFERSRMRSGRISDLEYDRFQIDVLQPVEWLYNNTVRLRGKELKFVREIEKQLK